MITLYKWDKYFNCERLFSLYMYIFLEDTEEQNQ